MARIDRSQDLMAALADYQEKNKNVLNSQKGQLEFLKQITNNFESFPQEYAEKTKFHVDYEFPTSKVGTSKFWPSNTKGNLILAAGLTQAPNEISQIAPDFFDFILEKKPGFIVALGEFGTDFWPYNKSASYGTGFQYLIKCLPYADNLTKIVVKNTLTNEEHELISYNIKVNDNRAFGFDFKTSKLVNNLCQKFSKELGVIHCASGIGRTGLFATLIEIFSDFGCMQLVDVITTDFIHDKIISEKTLDILCNKIINKICALRQIRPLINTTEQLDSILYALITLNAANLVTNEKEHAEIVKKLPHFIHSPMVENTQSLEEAQKIYSKLEHDVATLKSVNNDLKHIIQKMDSKPFHGGIFAKFANGVFATFQTNSKKESDSDSDEDKNNNNEHKKGGINNYQCLIALRKLSSDISAGKCSLEMYHTKIQNIFTKLNPFMVTKETAFSLLFTLVKAHMEKFQENSKDEQKSLTH